MYAIVLAGGSGERFWPLSRKGRPKQFLPLIGERTMLQQTIDRLDGLIPPENVLIIVSKNYRRLVYQQVPEVPRGNVIVEPVGRDTAAAVGLAALVVSGRDPRGVMAVLPSDHYIANSLRFNQVLQAASRMAGESEALVALGITPTRPETGYGYIKYGKAVKSMSGIPAYEVVKFTEKPDAGRASGYLIDGGYFWNSGVFIMRADVILRLISLHLPRLSAGLNKIKEAKGAVQRRKVLNEVYPQLPKVSIDYGIMENVDKAVVLHAEIGWDDVGSWSAWARFGKGDKQGNITEGRVLILDSQGCIVRSEGPLVAGLSLNGLVIIADSELVMICPVDKAQEVKRLVGILRQVGYEDVV